LVMANNGWIPFELAAAMVLGENIGTTITANIAALVGNVHAKRAALSHLIFNIFGVVWILILIRPALSLVDWYLVSSGSASPFVTATSIPVALSIFHSAFNILNTLLLVWFVNFIAKTVTRLIKSTGEDEFSLEYISTGMMNTAELSIEEARKETVRLGEMTQKMSKQFQNLIEENKPKKQKKLLKKIRDFEIMTDRMEQEITEYLMKVTSSGTLSDTSSIKVTSLLSAVNDLERIGDIFFQMSRDVERILKSEKKFKGKQVANLQEMMGLIDQALAIMVENLDSTSRTNSLEPAMVVENKIDKLRNALRKDLTKDIKKDKFDPQRDGWYKDLFHLCEKVGDHAINVSEAMTGEKERELKEELEE
ncbi:MAG: PhoU domain-containing protein, partial [Ekhidna sp.]